MPDTVEKDIIQVLKGVALTSAEAEICDFSIQEQNAALETQGVAPKVDANKPPAIGDSINYIVAAVIFNDQNEVLMIQEAKEICAGKWYLPAGRLDKGEDICKAAEREVLEETGFIVKCTTLLMVESAKGLWFRFVLTGKIVGGSIKTPANADKESIQAKWVGNLAELPLRSKDVVALIERGRSFCRQMEVKMGLVGVYDDMDEFLKLWIKPGPIALL